MAKKRTNAEGLLPAESIKRYCQSVRESVEAVSQGVSQESASDVCKYHP